MKKFSKEFSEYYMNFFKNLSKSIKELATIQQNYPEEYSATIGISLNPISIKEFNDKLNSDDRAILLQILLEAGMLERRITTLMQSTSEEKIFLSDDINSFVKRIKKLEKLNR